MMWWKHNDFTHQICRDALFFYLSIVIEVEIVPKLFLYTKKVIIIITGGKFECSGSDDVRNINYPLFSHYLGSQTCKATRTEHINLSFCHIKLIVRLSPTIITLNILSQCMTVQSINIWVLYLVFISYILILFLLHNLNSSSRCLKTASV